MKNHETYWQAFQQQHQLTTTQLDQFKLYFELLQEWNDKINLTTVIDLRPVMDYHFSDSLALLGCEDLSQHTMLADVGTGGGFPGIPLKIARPDLKVILIEVTHKKIEFLKTVIEKLGLQDIEITDLDWRTFLRKTEYPISIFCGRASLQPEELVRAIKPGCYYKDATVVYWASGLWVPDESLKPLITRECLYNVRYQKRALVFFKRA
jgi:16S rRNA (guanine(527)-N(7))-methyltransferase RsmG